MFDLLFALLILVFVVLPIAFAVKRARWRAAQEARLDRLAFTVGQLREQLGTLDRRLRILEGESGRTKEAPAAAAVPPPVSIEARPVPAAPEIAVPHRYEPLVRAPETRAPEPLPEEQPAQPEASPPLPPIPTTGIAGFQRRLANLERVFTRKRRAQPEAPPAEASAAGASAAVSGPTPKPAMGRFERLFIENWTGILGALVVVAGVTFVGIYTALRLAPMYRFFLTLAAGGVLIACSVVLARRDAWKDFAAWIRSAGAAIALFACAAAGGLPGLGLQFIDAPLPALAVLLSGIALNLYLAWQGKAEVFASLHVVLSLVPLAIVPPGLVGLGIASAVAVFGVGLAVSGRWDRHLLVVLGAYAAFQVLWFSRMGAGLEVDPARLAGFSCAAAVFGLALFAHYLKGYAAGDRAPLQIAAHVGSAGLLAVAAFVYFTDPPVRSGVLAALAAASWLLARRARAMGIAWLYRADVLGGQAFLLLALAGALDLGASFLLVAVAAMAELVAFRWLVPRGTDALLDRIADLLPGLAAIAVILGALEATATRGLTTGHVTGLVMAAVVLALLGQRATGTPAEEPDASPWDIDSPGTALGLIAGALAVVGLLGARSEAWMEAVALAVVGGLLLVRRRLRLAGQTAGAMVGLAGAHLASWAALVAGRDWTAAALSPRILPLAALAAVAVGLAGGPLRQVAIVLAGVDAGLAAYLYLDPVSALVPGVAWLMLSLVALEIANRLDDREGSLVLKLGYGYLAAFAVAYATVIVQTPAYVAGLRARLLIELFALAVIAYWWFFRPRQGLVETRAWLKVHPWFVEVMLVGAAVTIVVELPPVWWAVAWVVLALALLSAPAEKLLDTRARFYSLVFYWVSIADMATVLSVLETPSLAWHRQPEVVSIFAIALQVLYVVQTHYRLELAGLEVPAGTALVRRLGEAVARRRHLYVYYPLFAGVAVFLFWRFDRSVLTLLWAAEAFVVFGLSAWLRENQFRYIALAGLAVCLVRLVFIDMAEANLGIRGVVFIGVGLLMLGMNAIYNRFRARFET